METALCQSIFSKSKENWANLHDIMKSDETGIISQIIADHFIQTTSHEVICIDNLSSGRRANIEKFFGLSWQRFVFIEADINTYMFSDEFMVDEIYHLACPASPQFYQKDPLQKSQIYERNLNGS